MSPSSSAPAPLVALVTGGARRIGRAIALDLAAAGLDIVVHYRASESDARATASDIEQLGRRGWCVAADLSTPGAARALADEIRSLAGGVDVLVNNASVFHATPLDGLSPDDVDAAVARLLGVHVASPLALVHALLPTLRASACGAVVNLGDACRVRADHVPYLASKAALEALTRGLARDLAPTVRVNMVAPGSVLPAAADGDAAIPRLTANVPAGRLGTVQEVADAVRFLVLGPEFVTGQVIDVDGGQYA